MLQLLGPAARQSLVEILPRAGERLMQLDGLGAKPFGVLAGHSAQKLLVEHVAIGRDVLHQRGQRDARIVGVGPVAADARPHQHRPGQDGRRLEHHLLARELAAVFQTLQHGVQRDLLQHESAATTRVVQPLHVPLAEEIIRPLVGRVLEVVRPGVDRQFVEHLRLEPGLEQQRRLGGLEDLQGPLDQLPVGTRGHAGPANVERNWMHPFVGIRLDLLLGSQHGHRPVAQVVVQPVQRAAHDTVGFVPRPALLQDGLAQPAKEIRLKQHLVGLVEEQIAMMAAVCGQALVEHQPQHRPGLIGLSKGVALLAKPLQSGLEQLAQSSIGRLRSGAIRLHTIEQHVQTGEKAGIRRTRGKIQITEGLLEVLLGIGAQFVLAHSHDLLTHGTGFPNVCHCAILGFTARLVQRAGDPSRQFHGGGSESARHAPSNRGVIASRSTARRDFRVILGRLPIIMRVQSSFLRCQLRCSQAVSREPLRPIMIRCYALVALLLAIVLPRLPERMVRADEIIPETTAARHGLTRPWFTQAQLDRGQARVSHVVLFEGILYVQTDRAMVHAIDAETGETLWAKLVGRPEHPSLTPGASADLLAIINGSRLYICNRYNGDLLYETQIDGAPARGPA